MFIGHTYITDMTAAPFETYLMVEQDYGNTVEAFGIDEHTPLDLDVLLAEVYPDMVVTTAKQCGGSHYAAIMTDGRSPDSCCVWTSCGFYLDALEDWQPDGEYVAQYSHAAGYPD